MENNQNMHSIFEFDNIDHVWKKCIIKFNFRINIFTIITIMIFF